MFHFEYFYIKLTMPINHCAILKISCTFAKIYIYYVGYNSAFLIVGQLSVFGG